MAHSGFFARADKVAPNVALDELEQALFERYDECFYSEDEREESQKSGKSAKDKSDLDSKIEEYVLSAELDLDIFAKKSGLPQIENSKLINSKKSEIYLNAFLHAEKKDEYLNKIVKLYTTSFLLEPDAVCDIFDGAREVINGADEQKKHAMMRLIKEMLFACFANGDAKAKELFKEVLFNFYSDAYLVGRSKSLTSTTFLDWFQDLQKSMNEKSVELGFSSGGVVDDKAVYSEVAKAADSILLFKSFMYQRAKDAIRSRNVEWTINALKMIREMGVDATAGWNRMVARQGGVVEPLIANWSSEKKSSEDDIRTLYSKYINMPYFQCKNDEMENHKKLIGNYQVEGATPDSSHQRVTKLINNSKAQKCLYKDLPKVDRETKTKREAFIDYLKVVLADTSKESTDPRQIKEKYSEKCTIRMNELLGTGGIALYEAAIEEEKNSMAFRDAVFLGSTQVHNSAKWEKKLVLEIGGPSSIGKSVAAKMAVDAIAEEMEPAMNGKMGNNVVTVDGGTGRQYSQMRQLLHQVSLKKGYSGIFDLEDASKSLGNVKKFVKKAALNSNNLHVVIPNTFTTEFNKAKYLLKKWGMEKYIKNPNVKLMFLMVQEKEGKAERLENSVYRMGPARSWSNNFDDAHTKNRVITMNNRNIGSESKRYQRQSFRQGRAASAVALSVFNKLMNYKMRDDPKFKPRYLVLYNQVMYVVKKDNDWVECTKDDRNKPAVKTTEPEHERWKAAKSAVGTFDFTATLESIKSDKPEWFEFVKAIKQSSSATSRRLQGSEQLAFTKEDYIACFNSFPDWLNFEQYKAHVAKIEVSKRPSFSTWMNDPKKKEIFLTTPEVEWFSVPTLALERGASEKVLARPSGGFFSSIANKFSRTPSPKSPSDSPVSSPESSSGKESKTP